MSLIALVWFVKHNHNGNYNSLDFIEEAKVCAYVLMVIAVSRLLRLVILLKEMEDWSVLIHSMSALIYEFISLGMVFFYFMMIYSVIGVRWFGGKISIDNIDAIAEAIGISEAWVWLNFNDFFSGIVSLFGLMALNGWEN